MFIILVAMVVALGNGRTVSAQDASSPSRPASPIFGECRTGYWSSNRNLDDQAGAASTSCLASWKPVLGEGVSLGLNARVNAAPARMENSKGRVREAYVRVESGPWTTKIGRQIIAWGRSDRISPTDNLSPRDYTALLSDDEEQRQGLDAAVLRRELSDKLSVSAVLARFGADVLPTGSLPQNLNEPARPDRAEYAFKLDRSGDGVDWSVSYYDGFDRTPRYRANIASNSLPVISRSYEANRTFGLDTALPLGQWTLRGEAAVTLNTPTCTGCGSQTRRTSKLVLGAERELGESMSASIQLYGLHRNAYGAPSSQPATLLTLYEGLDRLNSEFSRNDFGMTGRLAGRFFNDRLKLELGLLVHQPEGAKSSVLVRPRMSYALSDHIKISAGADRFFGNVQSYFGSRAKNSLNYFEFVFVLPL